MKIKYFLFSVLFAITSTVLFAQSGSQHFQNEKKPAYKHQHRHGKKMVFNFRQKDGFVSTDKFYKNHKDRNNMMIDDEPWENTQKEDGLMYVCDSAISYVFTGNQYKTTNIRDLEGRLLVDLTQIMISGAANPAWK